MKLNADSQPREGRRAAALVPSSAHTGPEREECSALQSASHEGQENVRLTHLCDDNKRPSRVSFLWCTDTSGSFGMM